MNGKRYPEQLKDLPTPFYLYDMDLLRATLERATREAERYGYRVHYALKANFHPRILTEMKRYGLGADCVSGNEVRAAIEAGISPQDIVFAGVAKSDDEIRYALEQDIFSFNCESLEELEVIDALAERAGRKARIALRLNPDVDPMTHKYISTGKADNKFGIPYGEAEEAIRQTARLRRLEIVGLHFHVGSQIRDFSVFEALSRKVNRLQKRFDGLGVRLSHINVGGGLGIDYDDPVSEPIPDFEGYFRTFHRNLELRPGQTLHFELGRSLVAQCGELLTRVLFTKTTAGGKRIALVDAGMTDLIRPALYQARHRIENLTANDTEKRMCYTVAGPVCESSDVFAHDLELPETRRGDLLTILSAGAYGRSMSSNYNLREMTREIFSDEF